MSDEIVVPPPVPQVIPEDWNLGVAGKKLGWMVGLWETAMQTGVHVAPLATTVIEKISMKTAQAGITIHINQPVFENALPVIIFAFLLMGHDFAKNKTGSKYL